MRVTLDNGQARDINRVVRHRLEGDHLIVEDIDGCLYVYALRDLRRYVPLRQAERRSLEPLAVVR
jgi:hypothetical protein